MWEHHKPKGRRWSASYYNETVYLFEWLLKHPDELSGLRISESKIMEVHNCLRSLASADDTTMDRGFDRLVIYVHLFDDDVAVVNEVEAYFRYHEMDGWDVSDPERFGYHLEAIESRKRYLQKQQEKEDRLIQYIREYVAKCEKNGTKPVKKHLASRVGYSYGYVRNVWKKAFPDQ